MKKAKSSSSSIKLDPKLEENICKIKEDEDKIHGKYIYKKTNLSFNS